MKGKITKMKKIIGLLRVKKWRGFSDTKYVLFVNVWDDRNVTCGLCCCN